MEMNPIDKNFSGNGFVKRKKMPWSRSG